MELNIKEKIVEARAGDIKALGELCELYKLLIESRARKFFIPGHEVTDISQEGTIGFIKAIKSFDFDKSNDFIPFAILCIDRHIISKIRDRKVGEEARDIEDLERIASNNISSPEDKYFVKESMEDLQSFLLQRLTDLEIEIYNLSCEGYSYKDIASRVGKNAKSIDNALQRIKKKISIWLEDINI